MEPIRSQQPEHAAELQFFIRIKHPSIDPAEITQILHIEPEQTVTAGPNISSAGVRRLHNETYWIAQLPSSSTAELARRFRANPLEDFESLQSKDALTEIIGVGEHDAHVLLRLQRFDAHRDFFERINREGGSITLIVDRSEPRQPVVLKRALQKLSALGIALEID